jgi:hypothetical protein
VSVLAAAIPAVASADVVMTNCNPLGVFSQPSNGRSPIRAFMTDVGVYELDTTLKGVRIWQRGGDGLELLRAPKDTAFRPYTATQIEATRPKPQRFTGIDADGNGISFKQPVGMDFDPDEGRIAVLSAGEYINQGLNQYSPSIQVYEIEETATGDGALSEVLISLAAEYKNAFYTTTNGWKQVIDHIYNYPDVLVTTNYFSDGSISSVTTNRFVDYTTNLLDRSLSTNWVYIAATNGEGAVTVTYTNAQSRTGQTEPVWWNPISTALLVPGFEYTFIQTNDWISVTTNYYSLTNYVFKPSGISTNANYLATATDVAFLGDAGFVASTVVQDYQSERSAFLVFGTDPSASAKLFPVDDLDRGIRGIAVDMETGDIYATVPDMAVVFRYPSPGGTPASWLGQADRTPVVRDRFAAGVANAPGSALGRLSNPADAAVWYPEGDGPFLLVADTANQRIQAFDPTSLSWTETNWIGGNVPLVPSSANGLVRILAEELGTLVQIDPSTGLPFDPEILPFVSTNEMSVVTNYYHVPAYIPYAFTNGNGVVTNYYRLETTAFPLFATGNSGDLAADPMRQPKGVWGQDGTTCFAVADTGDRRVRILGIEDLSALDSAEILALAVPWASVDPSWTGLIARDLAVTNASVRVDAPHADAAGIRGFVVREHDTYENELHFSVAPSRRDRTYTLSISDGAGVVAPVQGTVTIPAGSSEGILTFTANDGIVGTEDMVSWRDRYGNWVEEGSEGAVRAVTNRVLTTPAYTLEVSSDGFSTNVVLAVANVPPAITNATFDGYVVLGDSPFVMVQGLNVYARDIVAADEDLRYLWWTTTNINWAVNNLDWAVTNNDWAADASDSWSEGPSFPAGQFSTASALTDTPQSGFVTNTIETLVAVGNSVNLPLEEFEILADGLPSGSEPGTAPFIVVCTVLDKDGGAAIITFPTPPEPTGTADRWGLKGGYSDGGGGGGGGGGESTAVYAARFTAISGNNVTFVVTLVSGDPAASDTVSLESATSLAGPWTKLGASKKVGDKFLSGQTSVSITVNPAGSGEVRFYRVVQP